MQEDKQGIHSVQRCLHPQQATPRVPNDLETLLSPTIFKVKGGIKTSSNVWYCIRRRPFCNSHSPYWVCQDVRSMSGARHFCDLPRHRS